MITETPADAVTVAPAAATEPVEQEISLQERLNSATPEEYKTWEKGGDFPPIKPKSAEPPPKTETPAASTETTPTETGESKPPAVETAPASESGKPPQKKRSGDARILQLLEENKRDREASEKRIAELESKLAKPEGVKPASPAEPAKVEPKKSRPRLGDNDPKTGKPFATIADWEIATDVWDVEREKALQSQIDERLTKAEQQRESAETERKEIGELRKKIDAGKSKHADFDQVAFNPDLFLPRGSIADMFIRQSENPAEVLYYLGAHPEILTRFYRDPSGQSGKTGQYENAVHPTLQAIELARIEATLNAPATPTPKPSAPTKPLPPPPTVLSAKGSAAGDPSEEAVKNKSFADYEKAENARERRQRRA